MNILHVLIAYYPAVAYGGPIRSVRNLCAGLSELGHECTVCVTNSDGTQQIDVPCGVAQKIDSSTVYYFNSPKWHYYGYSPEMNRWLQKHIGDYDLVHISGIWSFPERYAAAAARKSGVPYIISPRGSADQRLVKHYLPRTKWLYVNIIDRRNLTGAATVHYTTMPEQEYSTLKNICKNSFVVPNATTFGNSEHQPSAEDINIPDSEYILFAGRINWKKQVDVLIRAFSSLREQYSGLRLIIAGPDDDGLGEGLLKLVHELGIDDYVEFLGNVDRDALIGLYKNAKLFALPSLAENFGHSAVEALAMGIPSVLSCNVDIVSFPDIAEISEVCTPDEDGVLSACLRILDDYEAATIKVQSGGEVVKRLFSVTSVCEQLSKEYQKVIEDS